MARSLRVLGKPAWLSVRVGATPSALLGAISLLAACASLFARLVPDVVDKPWHKDEAVVGEAATQSLPDLLTTVIADRGGPPLHYLAAYGSLSVEATPEMLRWPSVAFALGAVILCWDLGRRLAGDMAGAATAVVAATSSSLAAFGSFGRMYAAFAFTAALAADTFFRALVLRTTRAAVVAAAAAVLVAATHTYGMFLLAIEAAVALALWRGRPLAAGLPVGLVGLAVIPLVLSYLRLSERFSLDVGETSFTSPRTALRQLHYALGAVSGGRFMLVVFVALAAFGAVVIFRRQPAFLALWIAVVTPPALYVLVSATGPGASPRHLLYALPLWAAQVGAGFAFLTSRFPLALQAVLLAALGLVGASFHVAAGDPRENAGFATIGSPDALAAPASWLEANVEPTDVLFDNSVAFLAGLETTGPATTIVSDPGGLLERGLGRIDFPVSGVVLSLPVIGTSVDMDLLRERLGSGAEISLTRDWLLVRRPGPFVDRSDVMRAIHETVVAESGALRAPSPLVRAQLREQVRAACLALTDEEGRDPARCRRPSPSVGR